jgi:hypothetical protein
MTDSEDIIDIDNENLNNNFNEMKKKDLQQHLNNKGIKYKKNDNKKKLIELCTNKLRIVSMFSGCGGLDFAFHKMNTIFEVIYVNDFDRDSCNTYKKKL